MSKNFEEQTKKVKGGIRLAREELFKIVFGVETTEDTSDELKKASDIYLSNNEELVTNFNENQLVFFKKFY